VKPDTVRLATNFEKGSSRSKAMDAFDVKIDYVASARDRMFVRYS
jgi:hypothetical protein